MKHAPIVALALAGVLVAGCGGGSSVTDEEHAALQQELEDAQEAQRLEQARREAAEREAANERNRANQAEGQLQGEQEARQEAEERADDLEEEAGHTASQLVQANARQVLAGLQAYLADTDDTGDDVAGTADPTVMPRHRQSALVTTDPAVTFSSITTGTSGKWYRTSLSNRAFLFTDRLDVYTDAEAPDHVPFGDSVYNDGVGANEVPNTSALAIIDLYRGTETAPGSVVNSEGDVVGSLDLASDTVSYAVSSPFPRSGDPAKSFTVSDGDSLRRRLPQGERGM